MRSPRMSKVSQSMIQGIRHPGNKLTNFYRTPSSRILVLRVMVTISLIATAAIVGSVNYVTLTQNEFNFGLSQYKSISVQALNVMLGSFSRMRTGTLVMAKDYRYTFPNVTHWPYVALPGFTDKGTDLGNVSSIDTFIFTPLLTPEQLPSFNTFMLDHWASDPYYPPMAGYPGGMGIWATNNSKIGTPEFIYKETDGKIWNFDSPHEGLIEAAFQMTLSDDITAGSLGYNGHCDLLFGPPLDVIIDCVAASSDLLSAQRLCAFFSNIVPLPARTPMNPNPVTNNLQAFIFQPIILEDPSAINGIRLMGTLAGAVNWRKLLSEAVPNYVTGLDCVVRTADGAFTYAMVNGLPVFQDTSDLHDRKYTKYAQTIDLLRDSTISSFTSYQLDFYPRDEFFAVYRSDSPVITTVGAIAIILLCSCVFAAYDVSISRESNRKEVILDTKRRFVRFISHEIRTPLNTVCLGLKLLEMEMQSLLKQAGHSAHIREAIISWIQLADDIHGNSDSAVDVLNDLLNYDKIESGTLRLEFTDVMIWAVVKKTAAAFVMQAKQKSIDFQLVGECWSDSLSEEEAEIYENLRVVGDNTRIAQVMRNLLSNALKFTPEHGTVIVRATWDPHGLPHAILDVPEDTAALLNQPRAGSIKVSVTDSGAGLSPTQLAQICTEGTQFNANQLQAGGGSGLGLFISRGLAEQHGGNLMVSSDGLDRGSTFRMELPLFRHQDELTPFGSLKHGSQKKGAGNAGSRPGGRRQAHYNKVVPVGGEHDDVMSVFSVEDDELGEVAPARPRRILVIDDATSNRKLLMRILVAKGFVCNGAEDGQQAVDLYISMRRKGEIVDAILMDFEMPVMDGPTATKRIRELGCNCFIVGVTGNVLPADIDHFKAQGANMVLAKPLNVDVFESSFKAFRAFPDMDTGEILTGSDGRHASHREENTAKLHPIGAAANV